MNWKDTNASRSSCGKWIESTFSEWYILCDVSTPNVAEFIAMKDGTYTYLRHAIRSTDRHFITLSDLDKVKLITNEVDFFEDIQDFRSWVEVKGDDRFRNLVV